MREEEGGRRGPYSTKLVVIDTKGRNKLKEKRENKPEEEAHAAVGIRYNNSLRK